MIYLVYGDNDFLKRQAVAEISRGQVVSRYDGETMNEAQLRDVLFGVSLFEADNIVLITGISENSVLWPKLSDILITETDKTIVFIEPKLDKRTKTYKWLAKNAKSKEFLQFTDYQRSGLINWLITRAKEVGVSLSLTQLDYIVDRLGFDQSRLDNFINQLTFATKIDDKLLEDMLPMPRSESVFGLFESALDGNIAKIQSTVRYLEQDSGEDGAFMTMGLLASQAVNLTALVLSRGDSGRVITDFGVSQYALGGLVKFARGISRQQLRSIVQILHRADVQMKSTGASRWLLIEVALVEIASSYHQDAKT